MKKAMEQERAILREMLEIYSPSGQEGELADYLVRRMKELGFRAYQDAVGNAVGISGEGEREIVLMGHIDTVPGFIPVRLEGDVLYGRGAVDAKGPLAAFIMACKRVGSLPGLRLVLIGAVEEEAATSKGAREALCHFSPDYVIIGEPSGWEHITIGYKGRLLIDFRLEREAGHSAGQEEGVCAEAVDFWKRLQGIAGRHNSGQARLFDRLDLSLRCINSGSDGLREWVEATVGIRLPPGLEVASLKEEILASAGDIQVNFYGEEIPFRAKKNNPLVRAFLSAIRRAGGEPTFKLKTGTSDMNVAGPAWRCPIVAYGPGDSALDHSPHERIDLKEYEKAIGVLADVLRKL
ncbi:MAG: [LysW]-lysine hydrolase [Anaerolineae bacterium]